MLLRGHLECKGDPRLAPRAHYFAFIVGVRVAAALHRRQWAYHLELGGSAGSGRAMVERDVVCGHVQNLFLVRSIGCRCCM